MNYRCPKCKSGNVRIDYPEIRCFSCGYSEPLIDFPISNDVHRMLSVDYGHLDPGPCEPEPQISQVVTETIVTDNSERLRAEINHLRNKLNEHIDLSKKIAKRRKTDERY